MLTSQNRGVRIARGLRGFTARAENASLIVALALSACAMSAEDAPTATDDPGVAASALTPNIKFTATAAGGTVRFSPDGTRLATGSAGQEQAKVLSTANGAVLQTLAVEGAPDSISYSSDGHFVAIGSAGFNQNLTVYDLTTTPPTAVFQNVTAHTNGTTSVRFSPTNPHLLVTAGRDKMTKTWTVPGTTTRPLPLLSMSDGIRVLGMDVSPDGTTAASNSQGSIHIWRLSDGTRLRTFTATNRSAVAYSPDGKIISTGTQLFNAATGALIRNLNWPATGSVTSTVFTKSGNAVVVGGEDFPNSVDVPTIRYFRVSDGAILTTFDHLGGAHAYVDAVAISPDGASLAYSVATDGTTVLASSPF
jgi:WD40 repeat protein